MNNYEHIKQMSVDEMAKFLKEIGSKLVVMKVSSDYTDEDLIKQWQLTECE